MARKLGEASRLRLGTLGAIVLALAGAAAPAEAQTDFFNTDRNRPVRIEDAYATERYAFELKIAPLTLEREEGGIYNWEIDPELAYGIFPRTQIEIGFPLALQDAGGNDLSDVSLAGIDLSVLHNLNMETRNVPAFGIRGDLLFPVGGLAPDNVHPSVTGIVTRSFRGARFHVNAQYTFGDEDEDGAVDTAVEDLSRWLAGVAVDHTYPLSSLLVTADVFAREPLLGDEEVEWNAGAGVRYQLNPRLALDAGLGARLTGDDSGWFVTFGSAYAFGIRSLIPVSRRSVGR